MEMSKIVIISGSPRKNGKTQVLMKFVSEHLKENNSDVKFINLAEGGIDYYTGDGNHNETTKQAIKDITEADVWLVGTPIYNSFFSSALKNLFESFKYNISRIKALIVGSVTGTIIGLIPGAGGQIAGLVSYAQIKKTSSNKENFGKGEPDGIIAAESANNAMVGPSLVPLLTLGVPGSPTAAVLLGGLLIHGLFPGSNLFTVYAETTWTFINSLLVAQFMMLIFGLYISGLAKYVMKTPTHYMAAAITILAIFGTYSVQHNFADVIVMLFLGTTMFFLSKFGFTAAPIVLGIILGPIAETNFNQAKIIADTQNGIFDYLTSGPLNLTIIALCLISILYGVYGDKAKREKK